MIAINTCLPQQKTHKVRCPECRGRMCDMVVDEHDDCCHSYQILYNQSSKPLSLAVFTAYTVASLLYRCVIESVPK